MWAHVKESKLGPQLLLLQVSAVLTQKRGQWIIFHCINPYASSACSCKQKGLFCGRVVSPLFSLEKRVEGGRDPYSRTTTRINMKQWIYNNTCLFYRVNWQFHLQVCPVTFQHRIHSRLYLKGEMTQLSQPIFIENMNRIQQATR